MEQPLPFLFPALSVSELTRYLRQLLESDEILQDIWVRGEVSNLSRPTSGHVYFTLKDASASLRCVIWRMNAGRLRFDLTNGQAVEAHGYISLYERDGQYQLYVDTLRPAGEGWLFQEFMRLKARLEAEATQARARMPEAIVRGALLGIREHLIGLVDLLEARLGIGLGADIRMILARQTPVGTLDLLLGRRAVNPQEVVIVPLGAHAPITRPR